MVPIKIMERIAKNLDLTKDELVKGSLKTEIRQRLAACEFANYLLSKKYKLTFREFEKKKIVARKKYSFEVEEDYHNWDQAIDAIQNLKKDLQALEKE